MKTHTHHIYVCTSGASGEEERSFDDPSSVDVGDFSLDDTSGTSSLSAMSSASLLSMSQSAGSTTKSQRGE